jgi:hypothetical protein
MARQEVDFSKELGERIAENPERSIAMAAICGFAVGGGLSSKTTLQIILLMLEAAFGDRLIPALVAEKNDRRPRHKR